mgnify:CR=1 FL=1
MSSPVEPPFTPDEMHVVHVAEIMVEYLEKRGFDAAVRKIRKELNRPFLLDTTSDWIAAIRECLFSLRHLCRPRGRAGPASKLRRFLFPMPRPSWRRRANGARLERDTA